MYAIDRDAVMWRDADTGRAGSTLVIVMHGLGSHEGDLFQLAPYLPADLTIAALRAPIPYGGGWAWFDAGSQLSTDQTAIDASSRAVLAWLDEQAEEFANVGLLGFSQGGAMSLQLLRHAPTRFRFVIQLSGFIAAGGHDGDAAIEPIPAFFGYGDSDDVIADEATSRTITWMIDHLDVELHEYRMAHSIVEAELADVVAFLGRQRTGGASARVDRT